jgi:ABC-type nickel/cobalt efflux system permease component RcnA
VVTLSALPASLDHGKQTDIHSMSDLSEAVLSTQRYFQGVLAGHVLELFSSPDRFAVGMAIAVALGLVHALTPGHGKAVIFSYFLGQAASPLTGLRVAAGAALTHGTIAVVLVLVAGRVISPLGRPTGAGAWLEATAGLIVAAIGALYVALSVRGLLQRTGHSHGAERSRPFLAIAMGLLPCPLTIIVVGSAVNRGATLAGITLAAGISIGSAVTIGCFGLLGIALRRGGAALVGGNIGRLMNGLAYVELLTSLLILILGLLTVAAVAGRIV